MSSYRPYVVRQGESWATLAAQHGFDMIAVRNAPENKAIRELRSDPHVLAPNDVLYLPAPEKQWLGAAVGAVNEFSGEIPMLHGSIQCFGPDDQPLAGAAFTVGGTDPPDQGTTDGNGVAEFSFPSDAAIVTLEFTDPKLAIIAHVAHLDPIDTPSGVTQRMQGLGILPSLPIIPDADWRAMIAEYTRIAALQKFQKDQGIEVTGEMDSATLDALVKAYGA